MSNIQKQHKISPAIAWLTIQKFIIFYCPLDGEHTITLWMFFMDLAGIEQTHKILKTLVQVTIFKNFTMSKFAYL